MTRHRTLVRLLRAMRVAVVLLSAAAGTTMLFQADIGRGLVMPSWKVAAAPPLLYLMIAFLLLRHLPVDRKVGWALGACGVNVALGLLSALVLSVTYPMSLEGALSRALWTYVPGPLVNLVGAPLTLLAWRSRVAPARIPRTGRAGWSAIADPVPGPMLGGATPNWDAVLRPSALPAWAAGPGAGSVAFERSETAVLELPDELTALTPLQPLPAAAPALYDAPPAAAPPARPMSLEPAADVVLASRPLPTASAAVPPSAAPAPAPPAPRWSPADDTPDAGDTRAPARQAPVVHDEPVVRISLHRVAEQLPPDVFVLPPERLGESLREPHVLVVPRRLVVPQLGDGAVEIAWTLLEDQFPELALAMPSAEVRRRFPDWVISLPMDEVIAQIPAELLRIEAPAPDLSDIGAFPEPFTPGPPAPDTDASPDAASVEPPAVVPAPATAAGAGAPAHAAGGAPGPDVARVTASVPDAVPVRAAPPAPPPVAAPADPGALGVRATTAAGGPASPPPRPAATPALPVAAPPPAPAPAAPVTTPTAAAPRVPDAAAARPAAAPPAADAVDEESEALARTLALGLAPLGALDWKTRRVHRRPLVSFVQPTLVREAIDAMATSAAGLVERLAPWAVEQVIIRTSRLACVLTPLGTRGCLAVTVRRSGAVAMLELASARAAREAGAVPAVTAAGGNLTAVTTTAGGSSHRRLGEAARALAVFGPVTTAVAEPEAGAPGVYVFAGRDGGVLAGVARAAHAALVAGHDDGALGRLETVELRRGRERAVVRPLSGQTGAPAVLAVAGEVVLAGRAHRAVARAAALLEAR